MSDDGGSSMYDHGIPPPSNAPGGNSGVACWSPDFNVSYDDGPSLCTFVNTMMQYYENSECNGNTHWPKQFTVDHGLMAQAQAEAEAVANGTAPKGQLTCANWDANCMTGVTTNPSPGQDGDEWFYIDGTDPNTMFTAPESALVISQDGGFSCSKPPCGPPDYQVGDAGTIPALDCHFVNGITAARVWIYHYCPTTGPVPTRMGCGSAVDASGKAWRVLLEAP